MQKFIIKLIFLFCILISPNLSAIESIAKEAYLVDITSGQVLLSKNSKNKTFPSSMTKMMTVLIVFEKIEQGKISLDQEFLVSKKAWRMGGSKMFVEVNKKVSISDLLRGVIVQSGNDASIVLAEGISGSEELFAIEMNSLAKKIGLVDSNFVNSSGMPADNHYSTAEDLYLIAKYTIEKFPEFYKIYSENDFTFSNIKQNNRNPLLNNFDGNDGLKTGYTAAAGYGYVGSSVRQNRRLILVVNGLNSSTQRAREADRLMEWGFNNFRHINYYKENEVVFSADTWLGKVNKINLIAPKNLSLSIPKAYLDDMKVTVEIDEPVNTPIIKGQKIGKLKITYNENKEHFFDLTAENDVSQKGFFSKIYSAIYYLIIGTN